MLGTVKAMLLVFALLSTYGFQPLETLMHDDVGSEQR